MLLINFIKTVEERHAILAEYADLNEEEQAFLASTGALSLIKRII